MPVGQKQRAFTHTFRIRYGSDRFPGAGGMVKQSDALVFLTHFQQAGKRFLLMIHESKRASLLGRQSIFDILKQRALAQESDQFISYAVRAFFQLRGCPAIYFPSVIDDAVLLQKIIMIFLL